MYKKLKRCSCIFLLFAVTMSLAACDGYSNSSQKRRADVIEISDLQMALLCDVVFNDELDTYLINGQELPTKKARSLIRDDYLEDMGDRNLPAELSGFTVVDFDHGDITGFRAAAFKKNNNIVVVYCGTEKDKVDDVLADIGSGLFDFSSQDGQAKRFAKDNASRHPDCKIYVAGYSLGGRLAYLGTEAIIDSGHENRLTRVCTFNGLGVTEMLNITDSNLSNIHRLEEKMENYIVNYIVKGDDVSDGWIKDRFVLLNLSHIGKRVFYDCTTPKDLGYVEIGDVKLLNLTKHDLYTFIDALSEHRTTESPKNEREFLQDFDIVGSWKSVGDWGFGQAQPGETVTFDGEHCNFYSPFDTYLFYQEDGKWILSCENVLWQDVVDFIVEIIDNDNINIYYDSSSVTKLKRYY